ncbi:MAG: hypothetical protein ABIR46_02455 [Candidatus Saccharimonadales bacterium]
MSAKSLLKGRVVQVLVVGFIVFTSVLLTILIMNDSNNSSHTLVKVKDRVSKHMILPDEVPTLAIVEDKNKLQDEVLKSLAKDGDELLLYTKEGQMILYRPSIDKIVAVRAITIDAAQAQAKGATVKVLNGTDDADITEQLAKEITKRYPSAKITVGKAGRNNYEKTIVIDNGNTKDDLFVQLIELTKGNRGVTPLGEAKPTTDFVILIGKDYLDRVKL